MACPTRRSRSLSPSRSLVTATATAAADFAPLAGSTSAVAARLLSARSPSGTSSKTDSASSSVLETLTLFSAPRCESLCDGLSILFVGLARGSVLIPEKRLDFRQKF